MEKPIVIEHRDALIYLLNEAAELEHAIRLDPRNFEAHYGAGKGQQGVVVLVTFGTGPDISEWFGHSALVVKDEKRQTTTVYSTQGFEREAATRFAFLLAILLGLGRLSEDRELTALQARVVVRDAHAG